MLAALLNHLVDISNSVTKTGKKSARRFTSGAFTSESDLGGVSPEEGDVGLHPLQGEGLIAETGVGDAVAGYFVRGEETEGAELVVGVSLKESERMDWESRGGGEGESGGPTRYWMVTPMKLLLLVLMISVRS